MIDIETLKVGDLLTAKDECIMDETSFTDAGKPALIIGKKYPIEKIIHHSTEIVIQGELGTHFFGNNIINQFFEQ